MDSGISSSLNFNEHNSFSLVDDNIYDINGHGTMMYSILKGFKSDIIGISPDADILSIKILEEDESINSEIIYDAIKLAIEQKALIINLSISSYKYNEKIAEVIKKANNKNITVVFSSGDYSDVEVMFPSNMKEVVSVGAIGEDFKVLEMTSGSDLTDINAPGGNIKTLGLNGEVFTSSGTSQSTAIVSGYIALLKDYVFKNNNNLSNAEIINYIKQIKHKKINYKDVFEEI
nr:S8 family serine peptidase [Bacillus sp. mrc49]